MSVLHSRARQKANAFAAHWVRENHPDVWARLLVEARRHHGMPEAVHGPRPINHGTYGGCAAHWRRGEKPCEACRQALSEYQRRARARRKAAA